MAIDLIPITGGMAATRGTVDLGEATTGIAAGGAVRDGTAAIATGTTVTLIAALTLQTTSGRARTRIICITASTCPLATIPPGITPRRDIRATTRTRTGGPAIVAPALALLGIVQPPIMRPDMPREDTPGEEGGAVAVAVIHLAGIPPDSTLDIMTLEARSNVLAGMMSRPDSVCWRGRGST
jgi:hypothetical protein